MSKARVSITMLLALVCVMSVSSCRGWRSDQTPVHPNPNMDWLPSYSAQELSRPYAEGTTAWNGGSQSDKRPASFHSGKDAGGNWVQRVPITVDMALLDRGEDRYNIYCAACHTKVGNGSESQITHKSGWVSADLRQALTVNKTDGELFSIVGEGIRTMPGYASVLNEEDRWAIVAYVRALQKMYNGRLYNLPKIQQEQLKESR